MCRPTQKLVPGKNTGGFRKADDEYCSRSNDEPPGRRIRPSPSVYRGLVCLLSIARLAFCPRTSSTSNISRCGRCCHKMRSALGWVHDESMWNPKAITFGLEARHAWRTDFWCCARCCVQTLRDSITRKKTPKPLVDMPVGMFRSLIMSRFDALKPSEQKVLKTATGKWDKGAGISVESNR